MLIYEWPDGVWCYPEDLEEMLTFMSDDYTAKELPIPEEED